MNWQDHGIIFSKAKGDYSSHCQLPVVCESDPGIWRIYFSSRNQHNESQAFFIEVEAGCPQNIIFESTLPLLPSGKPGAFDQHGIMPTESIRHEDEEFLYYIGWNKDNEKPFCNSIGLARQHTPEKWQKYENSVLSAKDSALYTGTLGVILEQGLYQGFYLACDEWKESDQGLDPCYDIASASSFDGIHWCNHKSKVIPRLEHEGGIASARVIKHQSMFHMWYCVRGYRNFRGGEESYRIGYAQSSDLKTWIRKDQLMDSFNQKMSNVHNMLCYPYLVVYEDYLFMFYNGSNFGETGIAYATLNLKELPKPNI